jgi:hypothetical protein
MKEKAKALVSKNKNELSAARALYVSLDNADNVIEGGAGIFPLEGHVFCRSEHGRIIALRYVTLGMSLG